MEGKVKGEKKVVRSRRSRQDTGLFNVMAIDELTRNMERAMGSVRKIAEASSKIRPLLETMVAFEGWAAQMPGSRDAVSRSPVGSSEPQVPTGNLPTEWAPPGGMTELSDLPAETVQKVLGIEKGTMSVAKYGRDSAGQMFQEVAKIVMEDGTEFYYKPEPPGSVRGRFWLPGHLAAKVMGGA